jgi:hypothetical protein
MAAATAAVKSIRARDHGHLEVRSLQSYHADSQA